MARPNGVPVSFQSTLPRRSDIAGKIDAWQIQSFNPRSREGATSADTKTLRETRRFNPRSREGATIPNFTMISRLMFQSTLPRRSDAIYHKFSFSNIQYSLTFCTNRTFQNLQISFDKCPFNTFCYFFRCESPDIFMYTVDSHRTRTT